MGLTKKKLTVLVTGSDAPGFSSIVRSLMASKYSLRLIATDWKDNLIGRYFAEKTYVLPDNKSESFTSELLEVCLKEEVDIILPIRTDDQISLAQNLKQFEDNNIIPTIITPNPKLMDIVVNKRKLLEYLKKVTKISVMDYYVANKWSELEKALELLGYPDKPVAIKPSHATGSRGFRILDKSRDKRKIFFEEKPSSIFVTPDDLYDILGESFPEMLVMEYLEEPEYTVDILCYKGKTSAIIPRRRLQMLGGITSKGIIEKMPKTVSSEIKKIVESFGFSYNVGMQYRRKKDEKEIFRLLEINPRLQGTTIFSVAAGINIPELMIDMALKKFDFNLKLDIDYGLVMERTYFELFQKNDEIFPLEEKKIRNDVNE